MPGSYSNKTRGQGLRLPGWDYRNSAGYFVTICTRNRGQYFGTIEGSDMVLNRLGNKTFENWLEIPSHAHEASLGEFIVMPNHVHGIIILNKKAGYAEIKRSLKKQDGTDKHPFMTQISPFAGSLSAIIRSFKSSVTQWANEQQLPFSWQARFHDHIIRNDEEFIAISNYIMNNPKNWEKDKFFDRI